MTETPAPDAAIDVLTRAYDWITVKEARAVVAALARAGMLCEPDRVAELEARGPDDDVARWLQAARDASITQTERWHVIDDLLDRYRTTAALDAVPAAPPGLPPNALRLADGQVVRVGIYHQHDCDCGGHGPAAPTTSGGEE